MKNLQYILISIALLAGCKLPPANPVAEGGKVVFSDLFSDNKKNWDIVHNDSTDIKILNNEYQFLLTGKSNKSGQLVWKAIDVDNTDTISSSANFRIEADFRYIQGDTLAPFGLAFGVGDANNYEFFGIKKPGEIGNINKSGGFIIGKSVAGVFTPAVSWTAIDLKEGYNRLKVEKRSKTGNVFFYSINNVVVYSSRLPATYGKTLGFYAAGNVSMAVDDVKVTTGFAAP